MLMKKKEHVTHFSEVAGKDYNHKYDEYVCTDYLGKIISPEYVTQHFGSKIKNSNFKHIRFHDLRHSCANLLLANGIPMKAIQNGLVTQHSV